MTELEELFYKYKHRPNKNIKCNSTEYINYSNAIASKMNILDIHNFKVGQHVHYMANTIIGQYLYNAKVIKITDDIIIIQPCGWKQSIKYRQNDNVYIAKGWR